MSARIFIVMFSMVSWIYDFILGKVGDKQREKPLPEEVSDVYDEKRYKTYLEYVAEYKRLNLIFSGIGFPVFCFLIFSNIFPFLEAAFDKNVYLIVLFSNFILWGITFIQSFFKGYYQTFHIEEKFGLNRKTKAVFVKDFLISHVFSLVVLSLLLLGFAFIGENLGKWSNDFHVDFLEACLICAIIYFAVYVFSTIMSFISYKLMRVQYRFDPMPEGDLKDEIYRLQEGSKKKVKKIYIYDESKKSVSKNAFLMKLLWHREFGIADNFMNENSRRELLAVLSHEIGHLKHKKNWLNLLSYGTSILLFLFISFSISHPNLFFAIHAWIRDSFGLEVNNYLLLALIYSEILKPVFFLDGVFENYRIRQEEFEADREAVHNGYGAELIATFKQLSSDELMNVNPHPVIEFLEYNHPGMYNRIKAIHTAMGERVS